MPIKIISSLNWESIIDMVLHSELARRDRRLTSGMMSCRRRSQKSVEFACWLGMSQQYIMRGMELAGLLFTFPATSLPKKSLGKIW